MEQMSNALGMATSRLYFFVRRFFFAPFAAEPPAAVYVVERFAPLP